MSISPYVDIEKYKKDKQGWGHIVDIETRCCYWRKFNALHGWMVKNVQNGIDDCGKYIVTDVHLNQLLDDLKKVAPGEDTKEFKPVGGFFFGSTNQDEYFYKSVEKLKSVIVYLLTQDMHDTMYVYQSSW